MKRVSKLLLLVFGFGIFRRTSRWGVYPAGI